MGKSRLAEAAYEGKLERVQKLIAEGAPLDGADGDLYLGDTAGCLAGAPYCTPLGEAARAGHLEVVQALVAAGAGLDIRDYRNETPLILAAAAGRLEVVRWLLERGADPHLIACLGNALGALALYLQEGEGYPQIAALLLAAGVSPTAVCATGETAVDMLLRSVPDAGKPDKHARLALRIGRLFEPHAGEQAALLKGKLDALEARIQKGQQKAARARASLDKLGSAAEVAKPGWPEEVQRLLGPLEKKAKRASVEQVCAWVLSTPAAVAHTAWPELVREVIGLSWTYGDVTEAMYGERLALSAMEEDEGGSMEQYADEHLYTFDWVLRLLATPAALAHPGWEELFVHLCAVKKEAVGYYSFGDDEVAALLSAPQVKQLPAYDRAVAAAREAFPFAPGL